MTVKTNTKPPDGGWGYVVAIGAALLGISTMGPMQIFGLIYNDFLEQFGDVASSTTIITTIFGVICSLAGLFTIPLSTKFSLRKVGMCGALLFSLGSFFCIFMQSFAHFIIAYSIFQGIGFGLTLPIALRSLNDYFLKRRPLVNNVSQALICGAAIFIPIVFEKLLQVYGFRGTVSILAAFSFHSILAMIVMQPVEWHMQNDSPQRKYLKDNIEIQNMETELSNIPFIDEENQGNVTENEVVAKSEHKSIWSEIIATFNFDMLMDPKYLNLSIGLALSYSADNIFLMLTPMLLFHMNYESTTVAYCITAAAISDLISRLLLSAISSVVFIKSRNVVLLGAICSLLLRYCLSSNILLSMIVFSGIGFARALIQTPVALCYAEQYRADQFTMAWGLSMLVGGTLSLLIGIMISIVAELFEDDLMLIHTLSLLTLLCIIPWIIEMFFQKETTAKTSSTITDDQMNSNVIN